MEPLDFSSQAESEEELDFTSQSDENPEPKNDLDFSGFAEPVEEVKPSDKYSGKDYLTSVPTLVADIASAIPGGINSVLRGVREVIQYHKPGGDVYEEYKKGMDTGAEWWHNIDEDGRKKIEKAIGLPLDSKLGKDASALIGKLVFELPTEAVGGLGALVNKGLHGLDTTPQEDWQSAEAGKTAAQSLLMLSPLAMLGKVGRSPQLNIDAIRDGFKEPVKEPTPSLGKELTKQDELPFSSSIEEAGLRQSEKKQGDLFNPENQPIVSEGSIKDRAIVEDPAVAKERVTERLPEAKDPIYEEVVKHVNEKGLASVADLRRKFGISGDRAERLVSQLTKDEIVSVDKSNGSNRVLGGTGRKGFGQGGAVDFTSFKDKQKEKQVKEFYNSLKERVSQGAAELAKKVESYPNWQYSKGDRIKSSKTGKVYTIEGRSWNSKYDVPMYRYKSAEGEAGSFYAENVTTKYGDAPGAHNSFVKMTGPTGGVGKKGFRQGGAINFFGKEPTLESRASKTPKEEWIKEYQTKYPEDSPAKAEYTYNTLNLQGKNKKEFGDNIVTNKLDYGLGAVSTRLGNIHPRLKQKSVDFEFYNMRDTARRLEEVDPFLTEINNLPKEQLKTIDGLLLDNDYATLKEAVPSDIKPLIEPVQNVLRETGKDLVKYGIVEKLRENYFPRVVIDVEGLLNALGTTRKTQLQELLAEKENKALSIGESLTEFDKSEIINSYLKNNYNTKSSPGFSKGRTIDAIPEELRQFYAEPTKALHSYLRYATFQIEQAKFFGKNLVKDPTTRKVRLGDSIGSLIAELHNKGEIKAKDIVEYHDLLNSRFASANTSPNALIQGFKDFSNIGLLGDVTNGLRQAADIASAVALDGIRPSIEAVALKIAGKEKVRTKDVGLLNHIAEEFVSDRLSTRLTNSTFKWNGLAKIDQILKDINLNSSFAAGRMEAKAGKPKSRLFYDYKDRFGDEFPQLVDDLKNNRRTELTDRFVFSQLSMRQPISKMESSQWAMDSPNIGRGSLTLKSFMIKQADMLRNFAYNKIKNGDVKGGVTDLVKISLTLSAANTAMDMIINFISNKPIDDDIPLLANFFKIFGFNEYFSDKIARGAFGEAVEDLVTPPVRAFDPLYKDIVAIMDGNDDTKFSGKSIKFIPFFGDEIYGYSKYGKADKKKKENEMRNKKFKEQYGI